jgi:putative polyhydroxyalkanoic acid system protein
VSSPVSVSVAHRLGKAEAMRRLKDGLARTKGHLIAMEREVWSGDTLQFQMRALGQSAAGSIEVREDSLRIEVTLPWLLAKAAERVVPAVRRETALLLEKK